MNAPLAVVIIFGMFFVTALIGLQMIMKGSREHQAPETTMKEGYEPPSQSLLLGDITIPDNERRRMRG